MYQAGETATARVRITNNLPANAAGPSTALGVWPKGPPTESALPVCSNTNPIPPHSPSTPPSGQSYTQAIGGGTVGVLAPGVSQEVNISFNVGDIPDTFIANAYIIPSCNPEDFDWNNNSTAAIGNVSFAYTVKVDARFETTGGDVGSDASDGDGGTISTNFSPPPRPQSGYLLVGNTLTGVSSAKWSINNYTSPLVAADPYKYMEERFRQEADNQTCTIPAGLTTGFNYCTGDAVFNAGNAPNGNSVFFIDGNLTIERNLELTNSQYSAIFIVKGNITVETDVTRIDGIYIAGETFTTTDTAGGISGSQLVVNGAVYGTNVNLSRKLGGPSCVGLCNNTTDPAEKIVYDPKYLIALNDLLGSPGVSWKEVAP